MKSDFMVKTAKIIAEIRNQTCIDNVEAEVIKEILQDELSEYYDALHECYDDGYDKGYELGYYEGRSEGYSEGYDFGQSDGIFACLKYTSVMEVKHKETKPC